MDPRCTEAFARDVEAAALRAEGLRQAAIDAAWRAAAALLRSGWRALRRRLARAAHTDAIFPEA